MTNSNTSFARTETTTPTQSRATVIRTVTRSSLNVRKPSNLSPSQVKRTNRQGNAAGLLNTNRIDTPVKTSTTSATLPASPNFSEAANASPKSLDINRATELYNSHTNLVVKSVEDSCAFYAKAFGWETIKKTSSAAVMQYKNFTFYLVAETSVSEYFGYAAVSPQTSGHSPSMTTTLLCDDVSATWDMAIQLGAIPVKSPFRKDNGSCCATLVGPDNYIWFITDSNNFFC